MLNKKYLKLFDKKSRHNRLPYALSSKPQRYGPGKNRSIINLSKEVNPLTTGRFALHNLLIENQEFTKKRSLFRYFKIEEIRAVFLPANVQGSFRNIAVLMSWWLTSHLPEEMYQDDATKLVPVYRTKARTLRFLPPRTVLDVQTLSPAPANKFFDFSQYLSTDFTNNIPGWLYIFNTSDQKLHFDFEAVVIFRGNDNQSSPERVIQEENPFIDKMIPYTGSDVKNQQEIKNEIISEKGPEDQKEVEEPPPEKKIDKIQNEIEKLKIQLAIKEKELQEDNNIDNEIIEDNISKKNKPK